MMQIALRVLRRILIILLTVGMFCVPMVLIAPNITQAQVSGPCYSENLFITQTINNNHKIEVCGNGELMSNYFVDTLDDDPSNDLSLVGTFTTTMAIRFDQHGNFADVGSLGGFEGTVPITSPSSFLDFSEETTVIYPSRSLRYQITQRTLTTDSNRLSDNNWTVFELTIQNTGGFA